MKYAKQILFLLGLSTILAMSANASADERIHIGEYNEKNCTDGIDRAENILRLKLGLEPDSFLDADQSDQAMKLIPTKCDKYIRSANNRDLQDLLS